MKEQRQAFEHFYNQGLVRTVQRLNGFESSTVCPSLHVYVSYLRPTKLRCLRRWERAMRDRELPSHFCFPPFRCTELVRAESSYKTGPCVCHVQFAMYGRFSVLVDEASWEFLYPPFKKGIMQYFTAGLQVSNITSINCSLSAV